MNVLFIHQNFPGQYLRLAQYLRAAGHTIVGLGETENIRNRGAIQGITTIGYAKPQGAGEQTHHYLKSTEAAVRRGQAVARSLLSLKEKNFAPDVICVHPGWGEAFFVRDVFPESPILMFCEYFFTAGHADLNFDREFPFSLDWQFSVRILNAPQLISMPLADAFISPTQWQASRYPAFMRERIEVIHEGVDTEYMSPDRSATLTIQPLSQPGESRVVDPPQKNITVRDSDQAQHGGAAVSGAGTKSRESGPEEPRGPAFRITFGAEVVTYIARNIEPYRGSHIMLRTVPLIQKLVPDAHVIIVGSDGNSYSHALPDGQKFKDKYLQEIAGDVDFDRLHFLGRVSYAVLRALYRVSAAHVYLTYPFVLSWSMLEAMACECLVIGSRTPPVEEVIAHGRNGLLVDFFDCEELARTVTEALNNPGRFEAMRGAARRTVLERFNLDDCLERQTVLVKRVAEAGPLR